MSVVLHTPGPWNVGPYFDNEGSPELIIEHQTPHGNMVVAVALPGIVGQHANGVLIAAAPDLLSLAFEFEAFAEAAMNDASEEGDETSRITWERRMLNARAAIARATGKAGAA